MDIHVHARIQGGFFRDIYINFARVLIHEFDEDY